MPFQTEPTDQRLPTMKTKNLTGLIIALAVLAAIAWGAVWMLNRHINEVKKKEAFKNLRVTAFNYHDAPDRGVFLDTIALSNPTHYYFSNILCQFYDSTDGSTKGSLAVGPLMPLQNQKFIFASRMEWLRAGHKYGIRIAGGTAYEVNIHQKDFIP